MKILFLTPWYPDEKNPFHGIFVRDQSLSDKSQHEVWVICSKIDYSRFGFLSSRLIESEYNGLQEFRLTIRKSFLIFNQLNYFILTVWHTWRIARKFQPEIIHGNIGYPGGFWTWCVSKILRKPFVISEHTRITNNFRTSIHKFLTVFSLKRASAVIAVSTWQAKEISSLLSLEPVIIPNIISFERFENVKPATPSPKIHVGFLGTMNTPVKGLDLLLKAVSTIRKDFTLHIGGEGVFRQKYRSLAQELGVDEKCIFYGLVVPEEVPAFMSRLHFFVNASRLETFGIAMVEAMAVGLPVVATNTGGAQDFITANNGMLVSIENIAELAAAVDTMMEKYPQYDQTAIRTYTRERYSSDNFLAAINRVYDSVVS